eukprot:scaffold265155_cov21-Tisochrysis_lutea.AAC.2
MFLKTQLGKHCMCKPGNMQTVLLPGCPVSLLGSKPQFCDRYRPGKHLGRLSSKLRVVRIKNVLTGQEDNME